MGGGAETNWPPNVTTAPLGVTQRLLELGEPPPEVAPVAVLIVLVASMRA